MQPAIFHEWRAEIEVELDDAKQAKVEALAAVAVAAERADDARIERRAINAALAKLDRPGASRSAALIRRQRVHEALLQSAEAEQLGARETVANVERRIEDLQLALSELDTIAPETVREPAEATA